MTDENNFEEEIDLSMGVDFDLKDASKPGLLPKATYIGDITNMKVDMDSMCILTSVVLRDNGDDILDDQDNPVDGQMVFVRTWLPKKGDENERTKDGSMSKKQSKINQMAQFFNNLKIRNVNTFAEIKQGCENGDFLLENVRVKINHNTYEGETRNDVKKLWVI
jgi:hypothetical protein